MATTTNYSWSTPDDTALVKDGAAAIRSLGTAIDTTVFTNAGAAVAKATVDAKGDLVAGTADNTVARLAVGANDTVLTADSSTATGLKWATPAAGGKVLQVVSATTTTQTAITSTTMTDSGLSVTITPTLSNSKVMILVSQQVQVERNNTAQSAGWRLLRDATMVYDGDGSLTRGFLIVTSNQTELAYSQFASIVYLDSPATTSAITYKTQGKVEVTTNGSAIRFQHNSCQSSIIALEIGA